MTFEDFMTETRYKVRQIGRKHPQPLNALSDALLDTLEFLDVIHRGTPQGVQEVEVFW